MDGIAWFRELVRDGRDLLEATMRDVSAEQAAWQPPGRALPIGAHYAHVIASQDMGLHALILGTTPLAMGAFAGKTGLRTLPPPFGQSWEDWARQPIDLPALREYAAAVYRASDVYFERLDDAALRRPVDLAAAGFGQRDVAFVLTNGWVSNVALHTGEIACLKGLQDAKGYPA